MSLSNYNKVSLPHGKRALKVNLEAAMNVFREIQGKGRENSGNSDLI